MRLQDLTLVVPTKNESENSIRFLQTIPQDVKLIVVDSSTDNTSIIISSARPVNTTIIHKDVNIPTARQIGVDAAKTPWILFTDADVHFAPDYFSRIHTCTKDAFYGAKKSIDRYIGYYERFTMFQHVMAHVRIPAASGSNMVIRKDALDRIGGFDTDLICNEDSELVFRLQKYGYEVSFIPELIVYAHDHRRIEKGAGNKIIHSLTRCTLLYLNIMPDEWKQRDWGYWNGPHK
jgi:GT2 family glycosyltransferase